MTEAQAKINDYRLEQAHLDWRSVRVQMTVGMLALFCLCLVNFWSIAQLSTSGNVLIAFCLYFGSCLLTALITLEITGRFGNRLGTASALWAGLLFCVFPWQAQPCLPAHWGDSVISFFALYVVFFWLRAGYKLNGLLLILVFGLAIYFELALPIYFNSRSLFHLDESLSIGIDRLLPVGQTIDYSHVFPIQIIFPENTRNIDLRFPVYLVYFLGCLIFLIRMVLRTVDYKALKVILVCMLAAIALANLPILFKLLASIIGVRWYEYKWCASMNSLILASAALSIATSLIYLPAIDSGRVRFIRVATCLGLIVLLTLSATFEKLFTSAHFFDDPYFDE